YNPMSVLSCVRRLVSGVPFSEDECVMMGAGADLVCSFSHHTSFARRTSGEFLENANEALERASAFFRSCNKVIITLGTSWCFRHIEKDFVVSNCLKRPSAEFARERLSPSQVTACLQEIAAL
ncbi:MAG: GSCFA domain-containing protein, partial [Prevotellamassilia sp.]|nr:GSCFA domain-containing protein [Prevotellamassilia sp.]